jgi:hypothetical protein
MGQFGLSSKEHVNSDESAFHEVLFNFIRDKKNPVIMDMCAGSGRDSVVMHDFAIAHGLNPFSIAVDCDRNKFEDAQIFFEGRFENAAYLKTCEQIYLNGKIPYFIDQLPYLTVIDPLRLPHTPKVDFMLCNAGIMFVKREQALESIQKMADMLSPERQGQLLLRFSTQRPEQHYGDGDQRYSEQEIDRIINKLARIQRLETLPSMDDVIKGGRGFKWHARLITRTPL